MSQTSPPVRPVTGGGRPFTWAAAYFGLAMLSVVVAAPGIMMADAPGAANSPILVTAALFSLALPAVFLGGAVLLLVAGFVHWRWLRRIAILLPAVVAVVWVVSTTLNFTWCDAGHAHFGCHS